MTTRIVRREHSFAAADASHVLTVRDVLEYRLGRNFVRVGDVVVLRIRGTLTAVTGVDVVDPRTGGVRTLTADRVARRAQSRQEAAK